MHEWDEAPRHLGPAQTPPDEAQQAPEQHEPAAEGPSGPPPPKVERPKDAVSLEDEFDPRYCPRCKKRIPVRVSEIQEYCDACAAELEALAGGALPGAVLPDPGELPPCPRCGSRDVEKEWPVDWVSKVVDVASGALDFLSYMAASDRYGPRYDPPETADEAGTVRVMRYRCRHCNETWKPRR